MRGCVREIGDEVMEKDRSFQPGEIETGAESPSTAERCKTTSFLLLLLLLLPSPWIERVWVVVDSPVEMDRSEIRENTPSLRNEVTFYLDISRCSSHDPAYDVAES